MKTIVIGCTHAGTAAVQELLKQDSQQEVIVYERRNDIAFLSCGIYLYLEGIVTSLASACYATPDDLRQLGPNVKLRMRHDVIAVDRATKQVRVQDLVSGEVHEETYDKLIMATGSYPIVPSIKGVNTPKVYLCKTYDDAMAIREASFDAKTIAIVGGGYIGTELAEAMSRRGYKVTMISGRHHILGHYVDPDIATLIHDDLVANGVDVQDNESVVKFDTADDGRVYLRTTRGELYVDMAICSVGFSPTTELLAGQVDMTKERAITVNNYMQTSDPDIYAVGDAVAVHNNVTGRDTYAPLATNAVRMGKIAGANIVHPESVRYMGTQSTSALNLFGKTMATTGLTRSHAEKYFGDKARAVHMQDYYRPTFMPENDMIDMTIVYHADTHLILGAQFYSRYDVANCANLISVMIQNRNTIEELAYVDMLFNPNYDNPWHYLNLLGQAAVEDARVRDEQA